jgi:hypothetical protein
MDLTTAYVTKRVELINRDGTIRDSFTLQPAEEWPQAVIWGVFKRVFLRDRGGAYREVSSTRAPMPPLQKLNGDWHY